MKQGLRPFAVSMVLGLILMLSSCLIAVWYMYQLAEHKIQSDVDAVRQSFSQKLSSAETVAAAFQDLAHASAPEPIPEAALQNFADSVMKRNSSLVSVLYYQRVEGAERQAFEAQIKGTILDTSPNDKMNVEVAAPAQEYYVLTSADRGALADLFVGWNLLSDRSRAETLKKSLVTGRPVSTDAYLLSNGDAAVEIIIPIFRKDKGPLTGVIGVVVNLTALLGNVELRRAFVTTLNTRFQASEEPRNVYTSPDEAPEGWLELPRVKNRESFDLYSYEIILGIEKRVFLSQLNYGILLAVMTGSLVILLLGARLARTVEKINALNRDLEKKVAERTHELQEILDNLDDAVMIIDDQKSIQGLHSPSAPRMLGLKTVSGARIDEVLFKDLDANDEAVGRHRFTMSMLFHADSFQWDISATNLLRTVTFHHPEKEGAQALRTLSVRYAPLFENDSLERLLIIASDITEILSLRQDAEAAREQSNLRLQIVSELLQADRISLPGFFEELEPRCRVLEGLRDKLKNEVIDAAALSLLFREIHTLKGNSRMLKMSGLSRATHHFEDEHASVITQRQLQSPEHAKGLAEGLDAVLDLARHYQKLYTDIFAGAGAAKTGTIWNQARSMAQVVESRSVLDELYEGLSEERIFSLAQVWASYQTMVDEIAGQLGKELNPLVIEGEAWLLRSVQGTLKDALTHIVRNALDHGLEKPDERVGKPRRATLSIVLEQTAIGELDVQLRDDGRGIDVAKVWAIARKKGLVNAGAPQPDAPAVIELLFASGFSTKDQSTDISGRGVGLDAVRSGLEQIGGKVHVTSELGRGSTFHLILPPSCVMHAVQPPRALAQAS